MTGVWQRAPLYVEVHDLARTIEERHRIADDGLLAVVAAEARALLADVSLALTFPADRPAHLRDADARIVRVWLRLACECGAAPPRWVRMVQGRLDAAGRMLGGWRRALARGGGAPTTERGDGSERPQPRPARRVVQERRRQVSVRQPQQERPGQGQRQQRVPGRAGRAAPEPADDPA